MGVAQTLMFWSHVWTLIWYTQWVHWHVNWLEMTWLLQIYISFFVSNLGIRVCVSQNFSWLSNQAISFLENQIFCKYLYWYDVNNNQPYELPISRQFYIILGIVKYI